MSAEENVENVTGATPSDDAMEQDLGATAYSDERTPQVMPDGSVRSVTKKEHAQAIEEYRENQEK